MSRHLAILILIVSAAAEADPWFLGQPDFADNESKALAEALLEAHGGMQAMRDARSLKFSFFTKVIGGHTPFYSIEAVELATGNAYIDWPFWDATIAWNDGEVWSHQWPMPMPAGFFVRLTFSFITLPWLIHADAANVGPVSTGRLPNDDAAYDVLRVTFDRRNPSIPGTFYEIFIDRQARLMKAVRFDINHPGMVANPNQPLGPNLHVFGDYKQFGEITIPTFYESYGRGSAKGGTSNAYHFVWNFSAGQPFDRSRLVAPEGAKLDELSMQWWQSVNEQARAGEPGARKSPQVIKGDVK